MSEFDVPDTDLTLSICENLNVSEDEGQAIWNEFFPRLKRFARKKLEGMPLRSFDEEDIALSAMNSFFRGHNQGRFDQLANKDELWRLLVTITSRKVTSQRRRLMSEKRGRGGVHGESVFGKPNDFSTDAGQGIGGVAGPENLPESAEAMVVACEHLINVLPDEKHKQTALLRMEGFNNQEISDRLQCSLARTKQRIKNIKELWAELE
ncbi:MAG TPA: ECF-type sigma factor [Pirellulaceae bacterium]|nr:ECF-type sigma factor [Pirellulaceae bacterium]HMP70602.1 ECF-type sigma factor [Pirellulaceae bacterium]